MEYLPCFCLKPYCFHVIYYLFLSNLSPNVRNGFGTFFYNFALDILCDLASRKAPYIALKCLLYAKKVPVKTHISERIE